MLSLILTNELKFPVPGSRGTHSPNGDWERPRLVRRWYKPEKLLSGAAGPGSSLKATFPICTNAVPNEAVSVTSRGNAYLDTWYRQFQLIRKNE